MINNRKFYLAYGANVNQEIMQQHCPSARLICPTVLRNHRLLFRRGDSGVTATVEPFQGGRVPAVMWEFMAQDEPSLDKSEGFPHMCRKETIDFVLDNTLFGAIYYVVSEQSPLDVPSEEYCRILSEAYNLWGFDNNIIDEAVRFSAGELGL